MVVSLLIDEVPTPPETLPDGRLRFRIVMPAREIRLVSGFARPVDFGHGDDGRHLGVALRGLRWEQRHESIDTPIVSSAFIDGFNNLEKDAVDGTPFRWTNGNAALPPSLFPPWRGEAVVYLDVKAWPGSSAAAPSREEAKVLSAFENLGENCEFSMAQRHFGAELPLSLLRWSGTTYEKLLRGLECRFEGLGDHDKTDVVWCETDYRLQTQYLRLHTTVIEKQKPAVIGEILYNGCATLRLLRRKLLRDIADARRIFVFRSADPAIWHTEMHRLHAALRGIGPASLLCVTLKDPARPHSRLERMAEGLYLGRLNKFVDHEGPFDEWAALCSDVLALHRGTHA